MCIKYDNDVDENKNAIIKKCEKKFLLYLGLYSLNYLEISLSEIKTKFHSR